MLKHLGGKRRLDELLVQRGLAKDVAHAQALILAGRVRGVSHPKAGLTVSADQKLEVEESPPFVSRGGLKLQAALKGFHISVDGRLCVDIGASTGGFTDCLLQAGAAKVLAVDVGHGQLDWKLRNDPRVINREKFHLLHLEREDLNSFAGSGHQESFLVTLDVSFISLKKVFPHMRKIFDSGTEFVSLVKPQFEVGPKEVPKGVVRDPAVHLRVRQELKADMVAHGFVQPEEMESPLTGPEGNREFLFHSWLK